MGSEFQISVNPIGDVRIGARAVMTSDEFGDNRIVEFDRVGSFTQFSPLGGLGGVEATGPGLSVTTITDLGD